MRQQGRSGRAAFEECQGITSSPGWGRQWCSVPPFPQERRFSPWFYRCTTYGSGSLPVVFGLVAGICLDPASKACQSRSRLPGSLRFGSVRSKRCSQSRYFDGNRCCFQFGFSLFQFRNKIPGCRIFQLYGRYGSGMKSPPRAPSELRTLHQALPLPCQR